MKQTDHEKKPAPGQIVHVVIDRPIKEFTGKIIAVIHRLNDVEDKWVAVPENMTMTAEEIMAQVSFQEQYFNTRLIVSE